MTVQQSARLSPRHRVLAFARRAWIQQGVTAIWLAAAVGGLLGALVFLSTGGGASPATIPELLPDEAGGLAAVRSADGEFLALTSYLLTMTPAILGMLVAIVATLTLPGVVADDISGGGIEALLAGPIPRRRLFTAYLGAALVLTALSWIVALLAFLVAGALTALLIGASVSLTPAYGVALVVVPLSMGIWSATATLFGALLYPRSLDTRAGLNGGPIRLVAMLPALLAVPSVPLLPAHVLPALGAVLAVTLLASLALVRLTARGFRSTRVLGG